MDIISKAIITALSDDVAQDENVQSKYSALKDILVQKFDPDGDLLDAVDKLEHKPDSEGRRAMLGEEIIANRVGLDPEIRSAAQALLDALKPEPPPPVRVRARRTLTPLQRPPQIDYFTGREIELATITSILKPGQMLSLCGPAGVGKSAIAASIIWQMASQNTPPDKFPDGIIYHSFYTQPRVDIALEEIARLFRTEPIPSPYEAVQRVLAKRKLLLVLDGVDQADDLPGLLSVRGNCGVLATSPRCPEVIEENYAVPSLPLDEAITLFRAWGGGQDDATAETICQLLGRLPVAIRLAGQYLSNHQGAGKDYAIWLENSELSVMSHEERQAKSAAFIIRKSAEQLSGLAKQALAVVGLLAPIPFDQEVIIKTLILEPNQGLFAAIRGLFKQKPAEQTMHVRLALRELSHYGFLSEMGERYKVSHPLIYRYAQSQLVPPGKATSRLATYYMALAWEQSTQGQRGDARLELDRPHFMRVMQECVGHEAWESAHGLAAAVEDHLDRQGYLADRVTANEVGLIASWQLGRPSEGAWLGNLGDTYRTMGHAKWAIEHFEKALATARKTGDRHGEGNSLGNLGLAYRDLGQIDKAMEYLQKAHGVFHDIRSPSAGLVRDWLAELSEWEEEL